MPILRAVLAKEFPMLAASELSSDELDQSVTARYLATGAPCSTNSRLFQQWPGPQEQVFCWYLLKDGKAIGVTGNDEEPMGLVRYRHNKIRHIDWNRLRTCRLVNEAGSFTKAAAMLSITQSAVSRQISALEQEIGTAIFIRDNTGLVLTQSGEQFLKTINRMWESLELGLAQLNEMRDDPSGPITITTTQAFGAAWLSSRLSRFHELYPKLDVRVLLTDDSELNLRQREADCAIRFKPPTEPGLVRSLVAEYKYGVFACRNYLESHGVPETISDLDNHDLVAFGSSHGEEPVNDINWLLRVGMPSGMARRPAVQMNSVYGIYRAVESGAGIASIPFYLSDRSDKLVEILPDAPRPVIPVYFVYPEELRSSKRIKILRDFIYSEIRSDWKGRIVSKD